MPWNNVRDRLAADPQGVAAALEAERVARLAARGPLPPVQPFNPGGLGSGFGRGGALDPRNNWSTTPAYDYDFQSLLGGGPIDSPFALSSVRDPQMGNRQYEPHEFTLPNGQRVSANPIWTPNGTANYGGTGDNNGTAGQGTNHTGWQVRQYLDGVDGTGWSGWQGALLNGTNYDLLDEHGRFVQRGTYHSEENNPIGPLMGAAIVATMAGGAAASGLGGAAGAGAAGTGAAGTGGLTAAELATATAADLAGGIGSAGYGSAATGAYSALGTASLESMAAAMGMTPEAFAALGEAGLGAAGASAGYGLPQILETASEGFGPEFEELVRNSLTPPNIPPVAPPTGPGTPPPPNPNLAPPTGPGVTPPNPFHPGSYLNPGNLANLATNALTSGGVNSLLGPAATVLGGLGGAQGDTASTTQNRNLPSFLQGPVANDLVPRVQGLLGTQTGDAGAIGRDIAGRGMSLLGAPIASNGVGRVSLDPGPAMPNTPVAGNGVGQVSLTPGPAMPNTPVAGNGFDQVRLNAPTTPTNPYLMAMADDMQRRTGDLLGRGLQQTRGNFVGGGGFGGSRQAIAEAEAMRGAADSLQGQLAGMYGNAYSQDQNRALQQYQGDQSFYQGQRGQDIALRGQDLSTYDNAMNRNLQQYGMDQSFYGQQRGQDISMRGQDLSVYDNAQNRNLNRYQGDQSFWTAQRGQDLTQAGLGSGLVDQGMQTPWRPLQNAAQTYQPFTGNGSTTQSQSSGGGWQGALGGVLGGAQLGRNLGWW